MKIVINFDIEILDKASKYYQSSINKNMKHKEQYHGMKIKQGKYAFTDATSLFCGKVSTLDNTHVEFEGFYHFDELVPFIQYVKKKQKNRYDNIYLDTDTGEISFQKTSIHPTENYHFPEFLQILDNSPVSKDTMFKVSYHFNVNYAAKLLSIFGQSIFHPYQKSEFEPIRLILHEYDNDDFTVLLMPLRP